MSRILPVILAAASFLSVDASARTATEERLLEVLEFAVAGRLADAELSLDALLSQRPNYQLAHMLKADILASRAGRGPAFADNDNEAAEVLQGLVAEARARWRVRNTRPQSSVPAALISVPASIQNLVVVDTRLGRLYRVENSDNQLRVVDDYYTSIGRRGVRKFRAGDRRTPLGLYFLVDRLERRELHEQYGDMAFPMDYPNAWDRHQDRGGDGIWLHGTEPPGFARPPLDSDGCIVLSNPNLRALASDLVVGATPVLIGDSLSWQAQDSDATRALRREILGFVEAWRMAWLSANFDDFQSRYASDFQPAGATREVWSAQRQRAFAAGTIKDVAVSEVFVSRYPDDESLFVVRFSLGLSTDNGRRTTYKRLYLRRQDTGELRIVASGNG